MSRTAPLYVVPAESPPGRGAHARAALIEAGIEVFGERGLESATTRDIAQRSNQNLATIAYHFGSKEGLYLGVAEHIRGMLLARLGPLLDEIDNFLNGAKLPPERCLGYLQRILSANVATNREMLAVTSIIVREQTHPTDAFSIFYDGVLARLHSVGARLVASFVGGDPESPEFIVRFHALLGESLAFRFARETIIRRAKWKEIGDAEQPLVEAVINEHAELVLRGLRANNRRTRGRKISKTKPRRQP